MLLLNFDLECVGWTKFQNRNLWNKNSNSAASLEIYLYRNEFLIRMILSFVTFNKSVIINFSERVPIPGYSQTNAPLVGN